MNASQHGGPEWPPQEENGSTVILVVIIAFGFVAVGLAYIAAEYGQDMMNWLVTQLIQVL